MRKRSCRSNWNATEYSTLKVGFIRSWRGGKRSLSTLKPVLFPGEFESLTWEAPPKYTIHDGL
jgi:hypothetical protein